MKMEAKELYLFLVVQYNPIKLVSRMVLRGLNCFNRIFKPDFMLSFIFGKNGLLDHTGGGAIYFTTSFALINSKQVYLFNKLGF